MGIRTQATWVSSVPINTRLITADLGAWPAPRKAWICCLPPVQPGLPGKPGSKPFGAELHRQQGCVVMEHPCRQRLTAKLKETLYLLESLPNCSNTTDARNQGHTPLSASFTRIKYNSKHSSCVGCFN